jgi:2-polyprenyl-3-methyl-5-hydroxy-6-metoxy-1,4-benzoquinol methylase
MNCQICGNHVNNVHYKVKEMMLGLREEFIYLLCNKCRCLQIKELPENMEKYYPINRYYSFSSSRKLNSILTKPSFYQKGLLYYVLNHFLMLDYAVASIGKLNLPKNSRILDVGCGSGALLNKLKELGYSNLTGIDPFIDDDVYANRNSHAVKVRKITLHELEQKEYFDLIMFHHSFEHMPNPLKVLLDSKKHLENGIILIRTPVISTAFEKYGSNWYQIDAPRHFFIYSTDAMKLIIEKAGLRLKDVYFDSTESQFTWSERYSNNIAMNEVKSILPQIIFRKLFSPYRKESIKLNKEGKGDSAVFYITT